MEKKRVKLSEMLPVIEETLAAGGTVRLPITGTSMLPLLVAGRDMVTLAAVKQPLLPLDLPLYRRTDGTFVLHRVLSVGADGYTMCGDNQWVLESGISAAQVIGIVTHIERNGRLFPVTAHRYRLYVRIWRALLPVRKYLVRLRRFLPK